MLRLKEIDGKLQVCFVDGEHVKIVSNVIETPLDVKYYGCGSWEMTLAVVWKD